MYLVRYAEKDPDVALLSISSLQKALKDPNQLVRAWALRAITSVRIPVIVPIMLISIKQVRKERRKIKRKTRKEFFSPPLTALSVLVFSL